MLKEELYLELYPKYAEKFELYGLDFDKEFDTAIEVTNDIPREEVLDVISLILRGLLEKYKPKKKSGKIFKDIAMVMLRFLKFIKLKR